MADEYVYMKKDTWTWICDAARNSGATTDIGGSTVKLKASQIPGLFYDAGRVMRRQFLTGSYAGGGTDDKVTKLRDYACFGLTQLTEFNSKTCTEVGAHAFDSCTKLTSVNFPALAKIGAFAFDGCTAMDDVSSFAGTVTEIGEGAFAGCTALTGAVEFSKLTAIGLGNVYLNSVPFYGTKITSLSFPVFAGTLPVMPSTLVTLSAPKATKITDTACSGCSDLTTVNLPECADLSSSAFQGCTALTSVNIPAATSVGYYTFQNCKSLAEITLPAVTSVDESCGFDDCSALKMVDFPAATSFGTNTNAFFGGCTSLIALILRSSTLCTLGTAASTLTTYYNTSDGTVPALDASSTTGYIYVPESLVDSYKTATNWSTLASKFRALESYTVDGTTTGALDNSKI